MDHARGSVLALPNADLKLTVATPEPATTAFALVNTLVVPFAVISKTNFALEVL